MESGHDAGSGPDPGPRPDAAEAARAGGSRPDASFHGHLFESDAAGDAASRAGETAGFVRERFQSREIAQVLSHYDLGVIREIREYRRGSRRAAKLKISADGGDFLLKRRALGRSLERDRERAAAGHAVQHRAAAGGVPVAGLVPLRSGGTLLQFGERLYELHGWVEGERYDRHAEQSRSAGVGLARMHAAFARLELLEELPQGGFTDIDGVRHALELGTQRAFERTPADGRAQLAASIDAIRAHVDRVEAKLAVKGLPLQPSAICHGDFHPGNTLWSGDQLVAVIDFDSVRYEAIAAEVANAMLQFSVRHRKGEDPLRWPIGLVSENLRGFAAGYARDSAAPTRVMAPFIPWLMLSAIVAEAMSPIARDGDFAGIPAEPFLQATVRMMDWISERTRAISATLEI
jgi:Ser/Thr protein kinase RdoA (MazF antagonist)